MLRIIISLIFVFTLFSCKQKEEQENFVVGPPIEAPDVNDSIEKSVNTSVSKIDDDLIDLNFYFLGEKVGRKENFDVDTLVTRDNIERLYAKYDVTKLDSTYYKIESKQIYHEARYLSRLIKFKDNRQSKAITFYDSIISDIVPRGKNLVISLNSLSYSSPDFPSCFCGKIVIIDENFNQIFERKFKYPDHNFTLIDTLYPTKKGFNAEIVNIGFDSDDYYRYKASFNKSGKILNSSKQKVILNKHEE